MAFATPLWLLSSYQSYICACAWIKISIWIESFHVPKIVTFWDLKMYILFSKQGSDLSALCSVWEWAPVIRQQVMISFANPLSTAPVQDYPHLPCVIIPPNLKLTTTTTAELSLYHSHVVLKPRQVEAESPEIVCPLENKWNLKQNLFSSREPSFYVPSITKQHNGKFIQLAIRETAPKQNQCQDNIFLLIME